MTEQWFDVRITQTKVLHNGFASLILSALKLIEIVDSHLYENPSLSRVGEELAAHEADNAPFFSQHTVSRGSEGLRIQAERHRPRFLDDTQIGPVRRSTANYPFQEIPARTSAEAILGRYFGELYGKLPVSQPSLLSRPAQFDYWLCEMRQRLTSGTSSIPARLRLLGFASYRDYLKSEHWQEFRKKFSIKSAVCKNLRAKFGELRCQFCYKSAVLHLHHKTYKRLGAEYLSDVVLICADCHEKSHERHKSNPRKGLWAATNQVGRKKRKIRQAKARRLRLGIYAKRKKRRQALRASRNESNSQSCTKRANTAMSEPICECRCHGYHEVRKDLCEHCAYFCENHEEFFTKSPHATGDGYWLCDPCYQGLRDEAAQ